MSDHDKTLTIPCDQTSEASSESLDDLFAMLPEGTRIIISGKTVTFENMTPELLDVALSLNPNDADLQARRNKTEPE